LTSRRLDGRANGGAADTMRHRRDVPDAPCDSELEPAFFTLRRATFRGFLRKALEEHKLQQALLRLSAENLLERERSGTFANIWKEIEARHPKLRRGALLRPSDLPREIAAAKFIVRQLRFKQRTEVPDDRYPRARSPALADA
jgi:hypothetical protein